MAYSTDASRWRALSMRDPLAAHAFVYTVKSTNVYCRPTCPARLARRANVSFCNTPEEAAALGFRACKRCKPDLAPELLEDPQEKAVEKACAIIEEAVRNAVGEGKTGKLGDGVRLGDLAKSVGLTPRYFHKIFKEKRGCTPKEWAKRCMEKRTEAGAEDRTPSLVRDSPPDISDFNLDTFDFNELVDFDADGLAVDDGDALGMVEPAMVPLEGFGDFDVNATMLTWDTFAPDYLDSGYQLADDRIAKWADASVISDVAMTKTSATFEQDAAMILSMGTVPDLSNGMYMNTFG